jgi:glycosyltransferase involved in cell wall biosynthesis
MSAKKEKLLIISGLYYPDIGGTENECRKISKRLKTLGYDVSVLTQHRNDLPAFETVDGIPVHRQIQTWHFFEFTYMLSVLFFLIRNRRNFDCVLCFGLYLFTAPAVLFCRLTGRKVCFRIESARQTGDFVRISKLALGKFILMCSKLAHVAIAISTEIQTELFNHGFSKKKILRIPNSVDTDLFFPGIIEHKDPFIICYIGRLAEGKGLSTLIKALSCLKNHTEQFKALIVGDGELKNTLVKQINKLGLHNFVSFAGEVQNVVPFLQQSHLFVLPSFSEGMPLGLLEAMSCGVCTIATRVGGIIDIMGCSNETITEPGTFNILSNGIMFTPGDEVALSGAVLKLMKDQDLRMRIAKNALKTVSLYSLKTVAQQYADMFSNQQQ